jgi:uncharacterized protein YjbI with pentapeptide repeats
MKTAPKHELLAPQIPKHLPPAALMAEDYAQETQLLFTHDNLTDSKVTNLLLEQVICRQVIFLQARWTGLRVFDSRLERCDLSGAAWEKARFRRVEVLGCRLLGVDLLDSSFEDVLFRDCNGEGALFGSANFKAARFENCNLRETSFEGADLTGVVFHQCDLTHANFRGAKLTEADLRTATIDGLQAGITELKGAIIAPLQAIQVVGLLGITVKENLPDEPLFS